MKSKFGGEMTQGELKGKRVAVIKPMEYMNVSGPPVQRAAAFFQIEPKDVIVVHDEIDLEFGRIKLKAGGGHGGHNGLRSIIADWGTADFVRVRFGIGRPTHGRDAAAYVLDNFTRDEQAALPSLVAEAADAVEAIVGGGLTAAMNKFNARKKT